MQDFIDIGNELDKEVPKKKTNKTKIEDDGFLLVQETKLKPERTEPKVQEDLSRKPAKKGKK